MKAFPVLSPCHPLGQSGSARPPCLTTSGGGSETPSQRLHQPNHPHSALPPSPPLPLPLLLPPPPSPPSAPPVPSGPQPMDLDRTNPVKRDPCSGLCFNCGKPGHITKVCRGPCTQNVWSVDDMPTLRLAPEDLQLLMESIRVVMVSSVPMTPLHESEGEKTPGEKGF